MSADKTVDPSRIVPLRNWLASRRQGGDLFVIVPCGRPWLGALGPECSPARTLALSARSDLAVGAVARPAFGKAAAIPCFHDDLTCSRDRSSRWRGAVPPHSCPAERRGLSGSPSSDGAFADRLSGLADAAVPPEPRIVFLLILVIPNSGLFRPTTHHLIGVCHAARSRGVAAPQGLARPLPASPTGRRAAPSCSVCGLRPYWLLAARPPRIPAVRPPPTRHGSAWCGIFPGGASTAWRLPRIDGRAACPIFVRTLGAPQAHPAPWLNRADAWDVPGNILAVSAGPPRAQWRCWRHGGHLSWLPPCLATNQRGPESCGNDRAIRRPRGQQCREVGWLVQCEQLFAGRWRPLMPRRTLESAARPIGECRARCQSLPVNEARRDGRPISTCFREVTTGQTPGLDKARGKNLRISPARGAARRPMPAYRTRAHQRP